MNRNSLLGRRRYMDDSIYRSTSTSPLGYTGLIDSRTPRYSPNVVYDERHRSGYFDRGLGDSYERQSLSPYDQGFYGYGGDSRSGGGDEIIRRTNREAAVANGGITRPSDNVQLHPMMTTDGRYPFNFTVPRRLEDFLYMDEHELDRIMMAYELGASRRRYYHGSLADSFQDDDMFSRSKSDRLRNLVALFEFLGAHGLVEHLRYRR